MQAVCRAEQETVSHLRHDIDEAQKEQYQTLQECEALRAQVRLQKEKEVKDTGDSQSGLATPELMPRRTESGADVIPVGAGGTETLGQQLRAQLRNPQAKDALLWRVQHAQQMFTPANTTSRGEQAATPRSVLTWDYQATQNIRPVDAEHSVQPDTASPAQNQPAPNQDDGSTPPWRAEGCSQAVRNPADVGPPPTTPADGHYNSQSCLGWSSNPDAGREDCHRNDQYCGKPESDDSDSSAHPQREGICTRQLESLAKDVEGFDPHSQEPQVDNNLQEVEHCLLDLANPSSREKLKLVWKTTARNVIAFMETLPPGIRDSPRRQALQSAPHNQGGEGSNQPHNQKLRYPNTSQQRGRDWSEQNPHHYQEYRYGDRNPKHGMHPGMEDLIRRCVAEATRNLEAPNPPGSPKKPDTQPHWLDPSVSTPKVSFVDWGRPGANRTSPSLLCT